MRIVSSASGTKHSGSRALPARGAASSLRLRIIAGYIDRILWEPDPCDLPIQLGTKVELVVNLKAKALGLTVPETILVRATS